VLVVALDIDELVLIAAREIPGAFERRIAAVLDRPGGGRLGARAHLAAAHRVDRLTGQALDMEAVENDARMGQVLAHRLLVAAGNVHGHRLDGGAAGLA